MQNRIKIFAGVMLVSAVIAGCAKKDTDEKEDSAKAATAAAPAFDKGAAEAEIKARPHELAGVGAAIVQLVPAGIAAELHSGALSNNSNVTATRASWPRLRWSRRARRAYA